jgi:hypothetical protein
MTDDIDPPPARRSKERKCNKEDGLAKEQKKEKPKL